MDDFFPKPFGRQALSELLAKWLDPGNRQHPQAASLDANIGLLPDLDEKVLDELWESLRWQREPLQRICTTFAESLESIVGALKEGVHTDRKALLRHLHAVLGSSGMVGARQIEYLTGRIQAAVKADRAMELKGAAEMLRRAMFRYEREFARKLDGKSAVEDWVSEAPTAGSGGI
jgi:HPt (histidine-containing phosphotransfer) domain-containing protein